MSPNLDLADTVARALDGPAGAAVRATVLAELVEEVNTFDAREEVLDKDSALAWWLEALKLVTGDRQSAEAAYDLLEVRAEFRRLEVESLGERERQHRQHVAEARLEHLLAELRHP